MNQNLETYLRIFCNGQQNDWATWLPLTQFAINSQLSHTTKIPPFQLLTRVIPRGAQDQPLALTPPINERGKQIEEICKKAYDAILHSQMLSSKDTNYRPFKEGEKVWLDAKNLHTTHPTHKLRAKRYGPFQIAKKLSDITYQVNLPPSWKIHNIFHTSYVTAALHSISALDRLLVRYASSSERLLPAPGV